MPEKFALLSVSDKTDLADFAQSLQRHGYTILSTGGTAEHLREAGIAVTDVSDVTGFPEILDGRVKTLHPKIHGGILARRDKASHRDTLEDHDIPPIDIVAVNLYPFSKVAARAEATQEEVLENIDIGGPCMVRAAAKNFPWVTVVVEPGDYPRVLGELNEGGVSAATRRALAQKAFAHTARYDTAIFGHLSGESGERIPDRVDIALERVAPLRYGENPHQEAVLYRRTDGIPWGGFVQLHGKELSYNNIVDLDAAYRLTAEFSAPAATIVKHTNPAGCAVGHDVADAFGKALACDPKSAFGGIIAVNGAVTLELAEAISESFFEIVAAPHFDPDALERLAQKKNLRLVTAPRPGEADISYRPTVLGWLAQEEDAPPELDVSDLDVPTRRTPSHDELRDLLFAWTVCRHVKSNAIVIARDFATVGVGAGQMSRVDAVELAIKKASDPTAAVLASDAFFPFRDGPDVAAAAGITAIIQPGGSVRDDETIAACDEHGIAMVFTGTRHFRH